MLFSLLNILRHNILMIVVIILVLVYAGADLPYVKEVQEAILRGIDKLSTYIDLPNLAKHAQDAFNNIKKMLGI